MSKKVIIWVQIILSWFPLILGGPFILSGALQIPVLLISGSQGVVYYFCWKYLLKRNNIRNKELVSLMMYWGIITPLVAYVGNIQSARTIYQNVIVYVMLQFVVNMYLSYKAIKVVGK